ncbi:MAG: F0F1 ATP synthase subunit gamma [Clostridia bacterium]|nr:F0F1 ATP synthase subunit gamma [Clostridia bacterium]
MGADIKSIRLRIRSVDSTLHLTKAMGLVASSKIRRATEAMNKGRQYASAVRESVSLLASSRECRKSPYLEERGEERTRLIVIAGDRGLAGGYNANIFRLLREFPGAEVLPIGKRACDRAGAETVSSERYSFEQALETARQQCASFLAGEYDRLGILYTRYRSMLFQEAAVEWVLPLKREEIRESGILFEPDEMTVLHAAIDEYVAALLIAAVRESFASEVMARKTAMDSAGKNAQEMIDHLQLAYNRARQGAITQEITEIVAGSGE